MAWFSFHRVIDVACVMDFHVVDKHRVKTSKSIWIWQLGFRSCGILKLRWFWCSILKKVVANFSFVKYPDRQSFEVAKINSGENNPLYGRVGIHYLWVDHTVSVRTFVCLLSSHLWIRHVTYSRQYRTIQNFGGRKFWQIWRITRDSPKFSCPKFSPFIS